MAGRQINNPSGAFGQTAILPADVDTFVASAAIAKGAVVALGTDGSVATAATDGSASLARGVAVTAASAAGKTVRVYTRGHVPTGHVTVDGATAAGAVLKRSVTTAGRLAATATPGVGEAFAISLAASASNSSPIWIL